MSPSKFSGVTLREGDQVKILMPGGGGYGDPRQREPDRIKRDLQQGFITAQAARDEYSYTEAGGVDG
jgi:N-methylhydantoinase B